VVPMVFIAEITETLNEQFDGAIDKIRGFMGLKKKDDPKKADLVSDDVKSFINDLERVDNLTQQQSGSIKYQRDVETVQIALIIMGYGLPKYGVDGLFGPETASAVNKFKQDNDIEIPEGMSVVNNEMSQLLSGNIKQKGIKPEELRPYLDPVEIDKTITNGSNHDKVYNFFIKKGLTKEQVAGVLGNLHIESNLNPIAVGDNGTSFGIAQWHKDRWTNLKNFSAKHSLNPRIIETQLEFLWWELNNYESDSLRRLTTTKSSSDAAYVFAKYYERPDPSTYNKRISMANNIYQQLG